MSAIATVDISRWYAGGADADALAAEVDEGLQRAGFIVVTGHGVDAGLAARVRAASREFFALPEEIKQRYSVPVGGCESRPSLQLGPPEHCGSDEIGFLVR